MEIILTSHFEHFCRNTGQLYSHLTHKYLLLLPGSKRLLSYCLCASLVVEFATENEKENFKRKVRRSKTRRVCSHKMVPGRQLHFYSLFSGLQGCRVNGKGVIVSVKSQFSCKNNYEKKWPNINRTKRFNQLIA